MIIKSITLFNLGPFVGENKILTNICDDKKITLIGGKNGAGKTTFFNAIKIALYGARTFGYEVLCQQYYENIKKLINDKELAKPNFEAFVELEISFDDGVHDGQYLLKREWTNGSDGISERKYIYCNDNPLSIDETSDFENLIVHFLPPSLFDFYFFDGEKISSLLLDNGESTNFKDAFIKICGLDNLSILVNCFKTNSNKISKNNSTREKYFLSEKNLMTQKNKYENVVKTIDELQREIDDNLYKIKVLNKDYQKHGGVSSKEWANIQDKIIKEEVFRENSRKELREFANNDLPFLILGKELSRLSRDLNSYRINSTITNAVSIFDNDKAWSYISNNLLNPIPQSEFKNNIINLCSVNDTFSNIYPLSEEEYFKVISQIESKKKIQKMHFERLEDEILASQKKTKELRDSMASINVEGYQNYKNQVGVLEKKNNSLTKKLQDLLQKSGLEKQKLDDITKEFEKDKKAYENEIKTASSRDMSLRGSIVFDELLKEIYNQKVEKLKYDFIKIFNKLINKKNLVDGIFINNDLSVYPYRFIQIERNFCKTLVKQKGEEYFIKMYGEYALNVLRKSKADLINLPAKIKGTLSEGENQVYLMSLYYALTNLSVVKAPFIIDTPFGRIDNEHRKNILSNFFKQLDGQLIILSTDEEINNSNISVIKDNISSMNLFKNNGNGKTVIMKNVYFGDQYDK